MPSSRTVPELVEGPLTHTLEQVLCSFPLMGRNRRIKAKINGPPHGRPKCLTFKSRSAFCEGKRQAPLHKCQAFSSSLGRAPLLFWPWLARPARSSVGVPILLAIQTHLVRHSEERSDPENPALVPTPNPLLSLRAVGEPVEPRPAIPYAPGQTPPFFLYGC